ncbi:MAG: hypothetical protein C0608_07415 [Deltaproteobacteria bacterium]|nr:MAG: hypothetical protein C0608_07415 [Deltaproteobacteria bacterium]
MNKFTFAILTVLIAATLAVAAPKTANTGQCVKDCVQAFNKATPDKGADSILKFAQKGCSEWCKDEYAPGDGYFWADGVCNEKYQDEDPDCEQPEWSDVGKLLPLGSQCAADSECQSGNCFYVVFAPYPYCSYP